MYIFAYVDGAYMRNTARKQAQACASLTTTVLSRIRVRDKICPVLATKGFYIYIDTV